MEAIVLTKQQAGRIIITAAGLGRKAPFGTGIEAVYKVIDHLGFVQLDTNYVVERAHHHVMAARIPDYRKEWLSDLCEDGRVYEYLTSDAGFLPMDDFRFSLPVKEAFKVQGKASTRAEVNLMKQIMDQVERDGAVRVGDFENDRQEASSGWWDWRPAKVALERLYFTGSLMISRTDKFQKVYDLPINLVPQDTDLTMPSAEEYAQFVIRRTLGALGICTVKEISWRTRRVKGHLVKKELENMLQRGELKKVVVEGVKGVYYMLPDQKKDVKISDEVFILSPFDILNVFRHRLKDFFDFDYQVECFVPAPKRLYGYFSLPVLAGERFIARMDSKADRKQKVLIVHNLHFEDVVIDNATIEKLIDSLEAFMKFNSCRDIVFMKSNKEKYLKLIRKGL